MANLSSIEKRKLERLLGMSSGYVLNFSDRTFSMFFEEHVGLDIDSARYRVNLSSGSKANRMRGFWTIEPDHIVAKTLLAMIEHANEYQCFPPEVDATLLADVQQIIGRLHQNSSSPVPEVDAFTASVNDLDFEAAAKHIRTAIDQNEPATALDRLHVFTIKFLRTHCEHRGIEVNRDKPLHSLMGEYVKAVRTAGLLESEMTDRILRSSILEAFNDVRNNKSLAHDNPILNHGEALLIFSHVGASIRFIRALEGRAVVRTR
ncbi:abortive infection family protein [Burkholderia cenocepacia]|uniref:Abortive infection family protein n=1 Tax=Burkholderia cenocepacia TaxID=95486 RepID=A0A1V2WC51_9BURK|nr:abortive infection family protein [Burkholderia cenocepacia]MBR8251683.1 abortive infection family protein [Burkholderia cenocepacia]MBR8291948.1 abortive infection family protein [Burkholderia cenocepacia]MBR8499338.1 abortive infection family protein [Burkholderia cenocepacia]ONJ12481.1 abortive infection family protein [Burkholderia cenocepacia]ONJ27424.1 abortive infection family protein [Burkholderia cenocepacia]